MTLSTLAIAPARAREFEAEADWWAIRDLLVRTQATTPIAWNWDIRHWDGSRFHREERNELALAARGIALWEADGRVVGAVHGEGAAGDAFLELDPDYRDLEPEMLAWAEDRLATTGSRRRLELYVMDYDLARRSLLSRRRYRMLGSGGWMRLMRFGKRPLPVAAIEDPYVMATTSPASAEDDARQMAELLNAAFGRTTHTAAEYLRFMTASPSFSHALNLVALAPDGAFAAHAGLTYDEHNRLGIFEPVCTHPAHQRHGLARALMLEGMHRLRELGARTAYVETGDMGPANALYRAVGFSEEYRGHLWERDL